MPGIRPGLRLELSCCPGVEDFAKEAGAGSCQPALEAARRVQRDDGLADFGDHRTSVEGADHFHDRYAGFLIAGEDGRRDRGGAPVLGQERSMDVEGTTRR